MQVETDPDDQSPRSVVVDPSKDPYVGRMLARKSSLTHPAPERTPGLREQTAQKPHLSPPENCTGASKVNRKGRLANWNLIQGLSTRILGAGAQGEILWRSRSLSCGAPGAPRAALESEASPLDLRPTGRAGGAWDPEVGGTTPRTQDAWPQGRRPRVRNHPSRWSPRVRRAQESGSAPGREGYGRRPGQSEARGLPISHAPCRPLGLIREGEIPKGRSTGPPSPARPCSPR